MTIWWCSAQAGFVSCVFCTYRASSFKLYADVYDSFLHVMWQSIHYPTLFKSNLFGGCQNKLSPSQLILKATLNFLGGFGDFCNKISWEVGTLCHKLSEELDITLNLFHVRVNIIDILVLAKTYFLWGIQRAWFNKKRRWLIWLICLITCWNTKVQNDGTGSPTSKRIIATTNRELQREVHW